MLSGRKGNPTTGMILVFASYELLIIGPLFFYFKFDLDMTLMCKKILQVITQVFDSLESRSSFCVI